MVLGSFVNSLNFVLPWSHLPPGLSIVSDHLPSTGPVDSGHVRARLRGAGYDEQSEDFEQSGQPEAIEVNYYNVSCGRVGEFIRVDNATWSLFLSAQPGFRQKLTLLPDVDSPTAAGLRGHDENCTVWTMTRWETRTLWHAVPLDGIQKTAAKFAAIFGHDVNPNRFPTAAGLTIVCGRRLSAKGTPGCRCVPFDRFVPRLYAKSPPPPPGICNSYCPYASTYG